MPHFPENRELTMVRLVDAPRRAVYRCWTEAELLKQWFAPRPWTVPEAELDVRPGGVSRIVMRGPTGETMPNVGVYLEVIENEKLVLTDAFEAAWSPKDGPPFMTVILTFADEGRQTRYTARVRHWTIDSKAQHEAMGFHAGWSQCADQLEELAKSL